MNKILIDNYVSWRDATYWTLMPIHLSGTEQTAPVGGRRHVARVTTRNFWRNAVPYILERFRAQNLDSRKWMAMPPIHISGHSASLTSRGNY